MGMAKGGGGKTFALAVYFLLEMIISVTHSLSSRNMKNVNNIDNKLDATITAY